MFAIAIDGPAAAGKSSIAQAVAKELDLLHVDTGALYRAVALYVHQHPGQDLETALSNVHVTVRHEGHEQRTMLDGLDVTRSIRTEEIGDLASKLSDDPRVRQFLLDTQRDIASKHDVVMDGRDIGTVILPDAQLKIYLTATPDERARRRMLQLGRTDFEQVRKEIRQRDEQDEPRLKRMAPDALILGTTGIAFDDVVTTIVNLARKKRDQGPATTKKGMMPNG